MDTTTFEPRIWGRWAASFVGFPLAGLAARAVASNIDNLTSAAIGGLAGGAALGVVQSVALRRPAANKVLWTLATAVGLGLGLAVGASVVDYSITTGALVVMGAVCGAAVGIAQAFALRAGTLRRALWAVSTGALWALGWAITAQVISNVDDQFATFGASGALVVACLGGLVLALRPEPSWASSASQDPATSASPRAVR